MGQAEIKMEALSLPNFSHRGAKFHELNRFCPLVSGLSPFVFPLEIANIVNNLIHSKKK